MAPLRAGGRAADPARSARPRPSSPGCCPSWPARSPPPEPLPEAELRHRLPGAIARALLAAGAPLLLIVDDVQWADAQSLRTDPLPDPLGAVGAGCSSRPPPGARNSSEHHPLTAPDHGPQASRSPHRDRAGPARPRGDRAARRARHRRAARPSRARPSVRRQRGQPAVRGRGAAARRPGGCLEGAGGDRRPPGAALAGGRRRGRRRRGHRAGVHRRTCWPPRLGWTSRRSWPRWTSCGAAGSSRAHGPERLRLQPRPDPRCRLRRARPAAPPPPAPRDRPGARSAASNPAAAAIAPHYEQAGATAEAIRWYERAAEAAQWLHAHADAVRALERALALSGAAAARSRHRRAPAPAAHRAARPAAGLRGLRVRAG